MALRYWVGGSGVWDAFNTANWSTSSGGAGGASAPDLGVDDVVFDTNSAAGSYTVSCVTGAYCKSISAVAPAAGTLQFDASDGTGRYFSAHGGDISVYSGCSWIETGGYGYGTVGHASDNTTPRTYTANFGGGGANTRLVYYTFTSNVVADTLNFSVGRTQTFSNIVINAALSTVNCTSATLTFLGRVGSSVQFMEFIANAVNLSSTTINVNGTTSLGGITNCTIQGVSTLTASSLILNLRGTTGSINQTTLNASGGTIGTITTGAVVDATLNTDNINSLTVNYSATLQANSGNTVGTTVVSANAYLNYSLPRNFTGTVSVGNGGTMISQIGSGAAVFSNTVTLGAGSTFRMGSGNYTFNGAVTTNGTQSILSLFASPFVSAGETVTFNASPTFNYTTVDLLYSDVTVNAPIAVNSCVFTANNFLLNAAFTASNLATGDTAGIAYNGTLTSNASGTISMTAATGTFLSLNGGRANLAASFSVSQGASGNASLNFNGGVVTTSTFTVSCTGSGYASLVLFNTIIPASSFNSLSLTNTIVNATGISVNGGVGRSFIYNVTAACPVGVTFDCTSLTVTTPTCSITGVVSRRVDMTGGTVSITGSTPTLSHVSFYQTTINNGLSAFTGTRLGTDGLSSGFVAQTPAQKFLVLGGATAQINTAVWALTSGGATSVNNYPLPQDTVVINAASGGGTLDFTNATAYLGSISVIGGAFVQMLSFVNMYGNYVYQSASSGVYFQRLNVFPSGISARSLTLDGGGTLVGIFSVYILPIQSFNFIGTNNATLTDWTQIYFSSGNITLSPTVTLTGFSGNSEFVAYANNANDLNIDGSTTISTVGFYLGSGYPFVNVSTTNYTVRLYNGGVYSNVVPATARNGSVVAIGNTATIAVNSTTATNPIVELRFQNAVPTTATTITLAGSTFVQNLTSGNSTASNTARLVGAAGRTITKTNGGSVGVSALQVTNVRASPANTFYAVAPNSSLVGDTAGWTLGTPPTTSSGGFLLF